MLEIADLNFDEDIREEVLVGLGLLLELVPALFADGRKPLQHELGATVSATHQLAKALSYNQYSDCESIFNGLADAMAAVGEVGEGIFDYRKYDIHNVTEKLLLNNINKLFILY